MNICREEVLKKKVLTEEELNNYETLTIKRSDGLEKWLFLHTIQMKLSKALESGKISEVSHEPFEPGKAPAIKVKYSPHETMSTTFKS